MKKSHFYIACLLWLADMVTLAVIGPIGRHAIAFPVLYFLGHILMILLVLWFPSGLTNKKSLALIFALGVAARLIFLPYPVGNDAFRYVWEGYIQHLGYNPYTYAPAHPALADIARGELYPLWQQINHPEFSAAYPPLKLLLFRALAGLCPNPFFFKIIMIVFDLGVMAVLMLMVDRRGIQPRKLLFYAANPLALVYIAGEGHLDVIQLFLLLLALYLVICKKHPFAGFLMLGLAAMSKYFALLALPFLINYENRWKSLAVFIPLLLYVPFMDAGGGIFQSLGVFANKFHYNDSIAVLIRLIFGDWHLLATIFFLMISLVWMYLFVQDPLRSVYLALGCLILFLPTLHPWYLVLIAPFLVFFPSQAWLYLLAAVGFTFPVIAIEAQTGVFQEIPWLKLFEYVPFYFLLIRGLLRDGYLVRDRFYKRPEDISVIIPVLNEADRMGRCLESLKNRTCLKEIIVADGGSTDKTRQIAADLGARVVDGPRGRGGQIENGVSTASGDVIMILHADSVAQKGVFAGIIKILQASPHTVGGACGMQFVPKRISTRLIAMLNKVRAILTGISFGDQAQFFRAEALADIGGYPSMMLMEDVELSLRLKECGRLVVLHEEILVSSRRWHAGRFSANLMTVLHLFPRYLVERRFLRGDRLNQKYYKLYYSKSGRAKPKARYMP